MKHQGKPPWRQMTDKLAGYPVAYRKVFPSVVRRTGRCENIRAEASHQHTREPQRQMIKFKSMAQAQHFLSVHGPVQDLFRVGRHEVRAVDHRILRSRAFDHWCQVTSAC